MASSCTKIIHDHRRDSSQLALLIGSLLTAVITVGAGTTSYNVSLDGNMPILLYREQDRSAGES